MSGGASIGVGTTANVAVSGAGEGARGGGIDEIGATRGAAMGACDGARSLTPLGRSLIPIGETAGEEADARRRHQSATRQQRPFLAVYMQRRVVKNSLPSIILRAHI